jgi:predicted 3-demethylubiquinone-9 3-methyltransferase (glyoxalase superfamily)
MPSITPFLWFNDNAEEAARFYVSVFPNSRIGTISRYTDAGPRAPDTVLVVEFELDGKPFIGLNGGPQFTFTEAVSFSIDVETQDEVDYYWAKLTDGGQEQPCGWLKDRFGLSWQVNPRALGRMLADADRPRARRVMEAMLKMKKIDIAALERAYAG